MVKLHSVTSKRKKKSKISTVTKNAIFSTSTIPTPMRIEMLVVSTLLNNFHLIKKVDFVWTKWWNYALKFTNGKTKNSKISTIIKNAIFSTNIVLMLIKIEMCVVLTLLINFHLITEVDFIWPKWWNYALKLTNGKTKNLKIMKSVIFFISIMPTLMKLCE